LKRKAVFAFEKIIFSSGSANRDRSEGQGIPCPGKKAFASPKKAVVPLFRCGFRRFSPVTPLPPRLLRKRRGEKLEGFSRPFWLRRLLSCPGNKKTALNEQRNLEMNQN